MAPNTKPSPTAMTALLPILFVCRLFGTAPLRQASGAPGLAWSVLVVMGLSAVSLDMLVRQWRLHLELVSFAMVTVMRALCTWSLAMLVVRRHVVADVLDELLAVADECGRLPRARPKPPRATRTTLAMAVLVATDGGLLAWDWWSGFRFYSPVLVLTIQLTQALVKLVLVLFAAKVRLLVDALADVNRQLAWLARRPPSGSGAVRTHPVTPLQAAQALHVRLVAAAEGLGAAWGGVLLPALAMVFVALWGEASWNVAGMLKGLYGHHAAIRPSLGACRIGAMFAVLLHAARTCDALRRQAERTAVTVHGILNKEDAVGALGDQEVSDLAELALQLAASRDRFAVSVCGLFDINSGLITTMINTVATYLSIQVPITLANLSHWDPNKITARSRV